MHINQLNTNMSFKDIILGHINELTGSEKELAEKRLKICIECPLFSDIFGGVCDRRKAMDPETGEVARYKKTPKYVRGCGCRMLAKATLPWAECVAGKWGPEN